MDARAKLTWRDYLAIIILPLVIVATLTAVAVATSAQNKIQEALICQTLRSDAVQLTALRSIAHELGIPIRFQVPEVPPECLPDS